MFIVERGAGDHGVRQLRARLDRRDRPRPDRRRRREGRGRARQGAPARDLLPRQPARPRRHHRQDPRGHRQGPQADREGRRLRRPGRRQGLQEGVRRRRRLGQGQVREGQAVGQGQGHGRQGVGRRQGPRHQGPPDRRRRGAEPRTARRSEKREGGEEGAAAATDDHRGFDAGAPSCSGGRPASRSTRPRPREAGELQSARSTRRSPHRQARQDLRTVRHGTRHIARPRGCSSVRSSPRAEGKPSGSQRTPPARIASTAELGRRSGASARTRGPLRLNDLRTSSRHSSWPSREVGQPTKRADPTDATRPNAMAAATPATPRRERGAHKRRRDEDRAADGHDHCKRHRRPARRRRRGSSSKRDAFAARPRHALGNRTHGHADERQRRSVKDGQPSLTSSAIKELAGRSSPRSPRAGDANGCVRRGHRRGREAGVIASAFLAAAGRLVQRAPRSEPGVRRRSSTRPWLPRTARALSRLEDEDPPPARSYRRCGRDGMRRGRRCLRQGRQGGGARAGGPAHPGRLSTARSSSSAHETPTAGSGARWSGSTRDLTAGAVSVARFRTGRTMDRARSLDGLERACSTASRRRDGGWRTRGASGRTTTTMSVGMRLETAIPRALIVAWRRCGARRASQTSPTTAS